MMDQAKVREWRFADEFDCDLYRLIGEAVQHSKIDYSWAKVAEALLDVRQLVRAKMSQEDREITA